MKLSNAIFETGKAMLPDSGCQYVKEYFGEYYWFPYITELIPVKKRDLRRTDWESRRVEIEIMPGGRIGEK